VSNAILTVDGVSRRFVKPLGWAERVTNRVGGRYREVTVHALDGVSLAVERGEVLGVVGESGCGKSTLGRSVAGLLPPSAGEVRFNPLGGRQQAAAIARRRG
jgi:peptide/nickel transport system ATP-binding protein